MEWKKDNTDSEKLKQMEKEYIEAALKMMKKAGINSSETQENPEAKEEKKVNRHLMKTCILVKNLSKEDIQTIKNSKQNQIDKEEKQKE